MRFFVFFAFAVLASVHCSDDFDDLEAGESKFVILYSETIFFSFSQTDREISSVIYNFFSSVFFLCVTIL